MLIRQILAILSVGLVFISSASVAHAENLVVNGGFDGPYGDLNYHIKERLSEIKINGWSGGDRLTYLCFPGSATVVDNNGGVAVWNAPGNDQSPSGGNFIMGHADPNFSDAIYQTIHNLVIGTTYQVSFFQAAGQNRDGLGTTWEQWQVSFGTDSQLSSLMTTPSQGTSPWEKQLLSFTAQSTSETLSFLAYGSPGGLSPISFLDDVRVEAQLSQSFAVVPEPSSIALTAIGFLGMSVHCLRRRLSR